MSFKANDLMGLWIGLVGILGTICAALVVLSQWKSKREDELRKNAAIHEERVRVLESQVREQQVLNDTTRREMFDMGVLMGDVRRNNKRLGMQNLSQQMQIDKLSRRESQLMAALKQAMIPIPEPDGNEDE